LNLDRDWIGLAAGIDPDGRALIGGARRPAARGGSYVLVTPREGGQRLVAACGQDDVEEAVHRARRVEATGDWSLASPEQRKRVLLRWADLIGEHQEELALLVSIEMGKPIRAALSVELRSLARSVRWYGELCDRIEGRHPLVGPDAIALVEREPAGVIGIVLPWNFPLSMVGYDVAPALALGNSVVVKPSEQAPFSVLRCCELALAAGVPGDALAVVPGLGPEAGAALGLHPDVDVVAVTGTERTGRSFLRYSADSNGKRIWPKLGGKTSFIICDDAPSIDAAASAAVWAAYFNQGQMCTGAARILVQAGVYEAALAAISERVDRLKLGDPLSWQTDVGPVALAALANEADAAISQALSMGAAVAAGMGKPPNGLWFPPVLLRDVPRDADIFTRELFAPVAGVARFDTLDEALELSASFGSGMAIAIWTCDMRRAFAAARAAKVGTCWINCFEADGMSVPFGGVKRSGYGRDKGVEALGKYSDLKTVWIELGGSGLAW
jgi:gamma-glutamyl-gamma-aminobutyraldehyde dehydrogenase